MDVRDLMTTDPACCTADNGLQDVARAMLENDCGAIPIVADGRPVGMVSDRDSVVRAVAEGRNPVDMTAEEIMSTPVATVAEDASIEELFDVMEGQQIRRVVVVDADGKVCGIVAQADVAELADAEDVADVVEKVSEPAGR